MNRRGFLGAILAAGAAPGIIKIENAMRIVVPKYRTGGIASAFDWDQFIVDPNGSFGFHEKWITISPEFMTGTIKLLHHLDSERTS